MRATGFTMIELTLTIALIGILFGIGSFIMIQGLESYTHTLARSTQLQQARFAMERMTRELRGLDDVTNPLQNIQTSQISFTDTGGSPTDFRLQNQSLLRGSDLLLEHVTALTFTGFKADNNTTSATPQVRRIRIALTTLPSGSTAPLILSTDIFLRNFMYERFR